MPAIIPDGLEAIATCGACWGPICQPVHWNSLDPKPGPVCLSCGRKPRSLYGPVVPMED